MKINSSRFLALALASGTAFGFASVAQQPAPAPARVRAKLDGFDLSKSGKSANQIGGASRDIGGPRLYAPAEGKAFSLNPVFYWSTGDPGQQVTFRLRTVNGTVLYEATLTDDHLAYPATAPALTPGSAYKWTVIPENETFGGAPRPAEVTIVGGAERTLIDQELHAMGDPATVFVNHRVWYDAVADYTARLDKDPADKIARKGRAAVYDQVPVTWPLADADYKMLQ